MKKISKTEKVLLSMNRDNYDSYRCEEHGIYQIRKDQPKEKHCCLYCKKKHQKLTDEQINELIK